MRGLRRLGLGLRGPSVIATPPAFTPASLFAAGEKGGYYDFTEGATLAVNADGTGGSPAIGAACKWASDQSPNANHLRNTVSSVIRRANGIETSGTNYGLFNMAGFGNWPNIPQPVEVIVCLELLAAETTDHRIISGAGAELLAGSAAGKVRTFSGGAYGTEFTPGLTAEFTVDLLYNGALSLAGMNTTSPAASTDNGTGGMSALALGSGTGSDLATSVRFKRLLVIGRALTAQERSDTFAAMSA